jgi:hypothetical protein
MRAVVNHGTAEEAVWQEIRVMIDDRRKLARAESRRMVELKQTITAEQLTNMIAVLATIINQHLHSQPEIRKAITVDLQAVLEREQGDRLLLARNKT